MENINRGSEWRKWDLHTHTKGTNKNDQFKSLDFDSFCVTMFKRAIEKDIKAIGITDYFSIDNYKKVINFQQNISTCDSFNEKEKNTIAEIFILPNVELRMLPVTDRKKLVNIHFIFNPDFISNLDNDFFCALKCAGGEKNYLMNRDGITSYGKSFDTSLCNDDAYKKGIENFIVSHENLKELLLNNKILRENTIVVVSNSNVDGASALQKHYDMFENENGSLDGVRKAIYQISDCIFSSNEKDAKFFAGKVSNYPADIIKQKCGSLKPCIHGSDAHDEDKLFNPDGNRYCWIKADLTFSGLKQILYEPDERVKIQQNIPDEKRGYQVIDSILLNDDKFWTGKIYLNENLNTIIGGRSTGKSTLMKVIAKKIDEKIEIDDEKGFIQSHLKGVAIKWKDGEETDSRDIQFFAQSFMHDIAKDTKETDKTIKDIISNEEENKFLVEYNDKNNELKKKISKSIFDVFQIQSDINITQTQLKEKGDKKGVETEIDRLNSKIQDLNKDSEITEEEIKIHQASLQNIAEWEKHIREADNDMQLIAKMKTTEIINNSYLDEYGFDDLSFSNNAENFHSDFENFVIKTNKEWGDILVKIENNTLSETKIFKTKIEQEKQTELFNKGLKYYNDNKELKDIQTKLKEESDKLLDINKLIERLDLLNTRKNKAIELIMSTHNSYNLSAQNLVRQLTIEHDEVKIAAKKRCNVEQLKEFLELRLNQRGTERQSFIDNFVNQYESNLANVCGEFLSKALNYEIDYKNGYANENVVNELLNTNWFNISFELTYQNDEFSDMSEGKQAFVILKLLLEFSTKECPILIDQPEDSLDNRAIYNELVQYLRMKKTQRQIILVTHNPNVVVSADSENVIVANQNGKNSLNEDNFKFQYVNGSLENTRAKDNENNIILKSQGIREHVCEILEGGKEAFENREKKYGFK